MNAVFQGFLRLKLTAPETGLFHQVLTFYYGNCSDIWLPRSGSLNGLRAQAQVHVLREEEMTLNLWELSAHALLSLFEKEPVIVGEEAQARKLVADLRKEIKKDIEKLTTCTHI